MTVGFQFEFSETNTYKSNPQTMQLFVNNILAPYFNNEKKNLAAHHVKRPYGRLTFGLSIAQRSFTPG